MSQMHDEYIRLRHFNGLDGLRCVAIMMVIWHHSPKDVTWSISSRGFLGVDLFFVLSGFLISTLLIREKAATGSISLGNFWMRRCLRLMPAYYALLIALLAAYVIFKPADPDTQALLRGFPIYAFYLSNWFNPGVPNLGITWSLSTEEQFYLVWPIIEAHMMPLAKAVIWALLVLLNQLLNFGVLDGMLQSLAGVSPARHLEILQTTFTPILLGVGLAHLLHNRHGFILARKLTGFRYAPFSYVLLLLLLLTLPAADISGIQRLAIHAAATMLLAAVLLAPQGATARLLECKPLRAIGLISYGMYLYHMFALHAARVIAARLELPEFPAVFLLGSLLTITVSILSYKVLEKWFLNLRVKFRPVGNMTP